MTFKLTITDEHGRVVAFATIEEDARFERTQERHRYADYGRYRDPIIRDDIVNYQAGRRRNEISLHMNVQPLKDGSLIKYYRHKPIDKLAGQ